MTFRLQMTWCALCRNAYILFFFLFDKLPIVSSAQCCLALSLSFVLSLITNLARQITPQLPSGRHCGAAVLAYHIGIHCRCFKRHLQQRWRQQTHISEITQQSTVQPRTKCSKIRVPCLLITINRVNIFGMAALFISHLLLPWLVGEVANTWHTCAYWVQSLEDAESK